MWTLLIVAITGSMFSADAKFHSIPFTNKDACVRAAKDAAKSSSSQIGCICISSETGEILKFQKE
jgi:hypothetical protein